MKSYFDSIDIIKKFLFYYMLSGDEYYRRQAMMVKIGDISFETNHKGECVEGCPSDDDLKKLNVIQHQ